MVTPYEVQLANHSRTMQIEESFGGGMKYTNTPLNEGYMRKLVNFEPSNDGSNLKVRMGTKVLTDSDGINFDGHPYVAWLQSEGCDDFVHHTTRAYVSYYNDDDAIVCRYAMLGQSYVSSTAERTKGLAERVFKLDETTNFLFYDGSYILASFDDTKSEYALGASYCALKPTWGNIHGKDITCGSRDGVFTSYELNTYIPIQTVSVDDDDIITVTNSIGMLKFMYNATKTSISWWIEKLDPKTITAVQAVNYGYNMLLADPYTFAIQSTSNTALLLDGILPYDDQGNLILNARAGQELTFKVAYRYPAQHATAGYKYCCKWTITDNNSESPAITLQPLRTATSNFKQVVTPGAEMSFTTRQTSFTDFTLTCYVYRQDQCVTVNYESDAMDSVKLTPLNVITVSYNYLTGESQATTQNLSATRYDLATAKGMCTWQQRMVLWGVNGCDTTLWVSEVNDPSWFPYPNNIEILGEPIVAALPFKETLLVFTDTNLYQLSFGEDGLTYTTKLVQQNLCMSKEDCSTIIPIQNMVFFKNANYYYMLVPGKYATNQYGELQLAPISQNISDCFDYFDDFIDEILPQHTAWNIHDWYCYLEQTNFRIVYKIHYTVGVVDHYVDVIFQYNTKTRCWTMQSMEAAPNRMVQWMSSVTLDSTFLALLGGDTHTEAWLARVTPQSCVDVLPWGTNVPKCILDTGYRNIAPMLVKKFRQAQFHITTNGAEFEMHPKMYVDNMETFNEDCSYEEDGQVYIELANDKVTDHESMDTTIDTTRKFWVADRCCIPFTGRGRLARLEFSFEISEDAVYRPDIAYLTWVYRTKSGRGGRDGYGRDD